MAALLASGCAGARPSGPQQVMIRMSEFKFEPANVTVKANQPVQVTVRNMGTVAHDWVVQGLDEQISARAEPGQSASAQFTPPRAGTFRIICAELGHEQAGMVGQLTVQ